MKKTIVECPRCGNAITPKEVEEGFSVVCPNCDDKDENASCCSNESPQSGKKATGCCCS